MRRLQLRDEARRNAGDVDVARLIGLVRRIDGVVRRELQLDLRLLSEPVRIRNKGVGRRRSDREEVVTETLEFERSRSLISRAVGRQSVAISRSSQPLNY